MCGGNSLGGKETSSGCTSSFLKALPAALPALPLPLTNGIDPDPEAEKVDDPGDENEDVDISEPAAEKADLDEFVADNSSGLLPAIALLLPPDENA